MNIFDAAKTNKRIKRKTWVDENDWFDFDQEGIICLDKESLLANDWQVEQPTVAIKREQFDRAWDEATHHEYDLQTVREKLIKELGL